MTTTKTFLIRGAAIAALMMAASCVAPTNDANGIMPDGAANHPITVEPAYRSLKVGFSGALGRDDAARLDAFVADYRDHGNGSISVSAPATLGARNAISFFADHINAMGIPRDHILVATHDTPDGDARVEINYIAYQAHTEKCGDWSENLDFTLGNSTPKNFGCAVQQNIAAQIADPRDLMGPRGMGESDAARRITVMGKYEQGQITAADKRKSDLPNEQSGVSSTQQ